MANEVRYLNSISDLGSNNNTFADVVIVKDNERTSGNPFVWKSSGTANGGTIYAGSSGVWEMQFEDTVNVKWFGAVGDGSTDDTAAIQAAINATTSIANKVYFPKGIFIVSSLLTLKSGIQILGYGMSTENVSGSYVNKSVIKIKDAVTAFTVFKLNTFDNIHGINFDNICIDGNKENTTAMSDPDYNCCGILIHDAQNFGVKDCSIRNCTFVNMHGCGARVSGDWDLISGGTWAESNVYIENCIAQSCDHNGFMVEILSNSWVTNNKAINCGGGIEVKYSRKTTVTNNHCISSAYHGIVVTFSKDFNISNNFCTGNAEWGICAGGHEYGEDKQNERYIITGNVCDGNGGGITNDPTLSASEPDNWKYINVHAIISNNVTANSTLYHGIYFNYCRNIICTANMSYGNNYAGVAVLGRDGVIGDNVCYGNDVGIDFQDNTSLDSHPGYKWGDFKIGTNYSYGNTQRDIRIYYSTNYQLFGEL